MRLPGAVLAAFLAVAPLAAQYVPVGGFGNVVFPAGRPPAGVNPWGNVVFPAMPNGPAAANRATGLVPGLSFSGNGSGSGYRHHRGSSIYAFPVYIGGYGYGYAPGYGNGPDQPDQPQANGAVSQSQPPVVINQYFGTPPPDQGPPPDAPADSNFHFYQAPASAEAVPSSAAPSYYLIAFKDHTIYSAVAYYTDGDTLHYFTSGNIHNQVSLALVDRPLTEQLNRDRNISVHLPQ